MCKRAPVIALLGMLLSACDTDMRGCVAIDDVAPMPESDSQLPGLRVQMDTIDLTWLYSRDVFSNDRLPARAWLVPDDHEVPVAGIRFRGNNARLLPKKSFNIRFESPHEQLFDSERINANAMYADPSMMREHLAMALFRNLERPAPRTRYFDMWINGVYEGLYLHVEQIDSPFLTYAGLDPGGTLVRDRFRFESGLPRSAFGFVLSSIPEQNRGAYLARRFISRGDPDWERLVDLVLWVEQAAPGETFAREFEERFDPDVFIDWLAIHFLVADVDSFADDYWLYLDHDDDAARWIIIPWDKVLSFGSHTRRRFGSDNDFFYYQHPVAGGWDNRLIELVMATPSLRDQLDARMSELMREDLAPPFFADFIEDTHELIGPSVARSPCPDFVLHLKNHHSTQGAAVLHNETLRDFVDLRYAFLERAINPVDGNAYAASVELTGTEVGDVLMFTDPEGWTLARLELFSAPASTGAVSIEVSEASEINGVDRLWHIDSEAGDFEAELSLYYRNDTSDDFFSQANWYTGGETATGEQWRLQMAEIDGAVVEPVKDSRANPFSNKVSGSVVIEPGPQAFVLRLPD